MDAPNRDYIRSGAQADLPFVQLSRFMPVETSAGLQISWVTPIQRSHFASMHTQ